MATSTCTYPDKYWEFSQRQHEVLPIAQQSCNISCQEFSFSIAMQSSFRNLNPLTYKEECFESEVLRK